MHCGVSSPATRYTLREDCFALEALCAVQDVAFDRGFTSVFKPGCIDHGAVECSENSMKVQHRLTWTHSIDPKLECKFAVGVQPIEQI